MKKVIAVFLKHGRQWNAEKSVREQDYWDDHAQFMDALFDEGKVILGGPFDDDSGSMVILDLESIEEARNIFQQDPWALQNILFADQFKEWTIFLDRSKKG